MNTVKLRRSNSRKTGKRKIERKNPEEKVCVRNPHPQPPNWKPDFFWVETYYGALMLDEAVDEFDFKVPVKKAKSESRQKEILQVSWGQEVSLMKKVMLEGGNSNLKGLAGFLGIQNRTNLG